MPLPSLGGDGVCPGQATQPGPAQRPLPLGPTNPIVRAAAQQPAGVRVKPSASPLTMVLPPVTMDLGLLLVSIGVVNLWRSRTGA
jgi:hypothetical protein